MTRITDEYVKRQQFLNPNLDISHRCIIRCPLCIRQKMISQNKIKRSFDIEEKDFRKILDFYVKDIAFCGQISDPIYHPNFLSFLKICNDTNRQVRISTNGTGKDLKWWEEAFSYGKSNNEWWFGVDGIDNKSELYRVGSNFENVWEMMKLGKKLGNVIVWQFIIFKYNEHEIDEAIEIAKREGFALKFVKSDRVFKLNKYELRKGVKVDLLQPSTEHLSDRIKTEYWGNKTPELDSWDKKRKI